MSSFGDYGDFGKGGQYGQQAPYGPTQTSGKAVASLIFGLLSFCLTFLAGLPAVILGLLALRDINQSHGRISGQGLAIGGLVTGGVGTMMSCLLLPALLLPAVQAAREAARRAQSMNNMKQIGMAVHNFHDTYQSFPPAGADQAEAQPVARGVTTGLSWRVRLLPFLEQQPLYEQFKLDEPWNSTHNQQLISMMPSIYKSPNRTSEDFKTVYLAVVGDEQPGQKTAFSRTELATFARIIDGTSNTIMIVEADPDQAVTWTQPDDWELDVNNPARGLGHLRPRGFCALFCDASVYFIRTDTDTENLRRLFVCDDGQLIDRSVFLTGRP